MQAGFAAQPTGEKSPEPERIVHTPVQILQNGVCIDASAVPSLRAEFQETGIVPMRGFLSPAVRDLLLRGASRAEFRLKDEVRGGSGAVFGTTRLVPNTDPFMSMVQFALNRPDLFRLVSEVCEIPKPGNFLGRIHRTESAAAESIDWHDDAIDGRILGLNINLSPEPFSGGLFQLRGPDRRARGEVHFEEPGDAFLFRIGNGWQHRLTPVAQGVRTVAVGWFRTAPDWERIALPGIYNGSIVMTNWI